jgi:membrane-associated phospholipid phosphatase
MGLAGLYSTVFAPELFVLYATALLAGYEWRVRDWSERTLAVRLAAVLAGWLLAFAVYAAGPELVAGGAPGGDDFYASAGLVAGFAVIWAAWTRHRVDSVGPAYCLLLVATSVVHAAVVPAWDVSSHVLYVTVPVVYLASVDRRFAALLVLPAAMAWSRAATGAHSALESVGGLALGALLVAGAAAVRRRRRRRGATSRPTGRSE